MSEINKVYHLEMPHGLDRLVQELISRGYDVIAPTLKDRAVVLSSISSANDLPRGMSDYQDAGVYQIKKNKNDKSYFGYNLGPSSWKSFLFPPRRRLWQLSRNGNPDLTIETKKPYAFFGIRACELAAIGIQDKVFIREGGDPEYKRRRAGVFLVGVHCRTAASTCFCPSMGTGPDFPEAGVDLLLTEVDEGHLIEARSERGLSVLAMLPVREAGENSREIIADQLQHTRGLISRDMNQKDIKETIYKSLESHNWDDVASRCLSCANCTLVCPTCFCSTVEDVSDVEDVQAERWQNWDSCFHIDFSYVHGGPRRLTTASRYRQWFTHKLASWHDQFGMSGCVGCGRCIAWCPVGIDLTAEMRQLREGSTGRLEEASS